MSYKVLAQACRAARTGKHTGGRNLVAASRAIEPVATILALGIGETLLLFTLGALAIHLAVSDVIFKNQAAFCTDFGITAMIGCLAAWCRTDKNRMTGITPVLTTSHLFTNRTLFHQSTSINNLKQQNTLSTTMTLLVTR